MVDRGGGRASLRRIQSAMVGDGSVFEQSELRLGACFVGESAYWRVAGDGSVRSGAGADHEEP